jgi:hypothetical protein
VDVAVILEEQTASACVKGVSQARNERSSDWKQNLVSCLFTPELLNPKNGGDMYVWLTFIRLHGISQKIFTMYFAAKSIIYLTFTVKQLTEKH